MQNRWDCKNEHMAMHDLLEAALDVQENTEHYVSVDFSCFGHDVYVYVILGGFDINKDYDYSKGFNRNEVGAIRQAEGYIRRLLKDETPAAGTAGESR